MRWQVIAVKNQPFIFKPQVCVYHREHCKIFLKLLDDAPC